MRRRISRKGQPTTKQQQLSHTRVGNLGFLIAVPGVLVLAGLSSAFCILAFSQAPATTNQWIFFGGGLLASIALSLTFTVSRLRTLLHEIKHGVLVVLSGNSVKGITIGKNSGHIDYTMRYDKLHFAPIICLAPYFFPLLSAPLLIAAIILDLQHRDLFLFLLGLGLGFDTCTAFYDLHPNQTDLKRIIGGFFIASIFIAAAHIFWITTCLTWVQAATQGYVYATTQIYKKVSDALQ